MLIYNSSCYLKEYCQNMIEYKEKMKYFGKQNYSISEYIIIRYVYPVMDGESSVFLKNGQTYEFPNYIRGKKIDELTFKEENIISFDEPYKEFLKKNMLALNDEHKWTCHKFITAWVLKHYTTIYDEVDF